MTPESNQNADFQDHHGSEIDCRMEFLDRTINDVLGKNQKLGGIESFIEDCMRFVDDLSDGIADARHGTLHVWRPPAVRMPEGANRYEESGDLEEPPAKEQKTPPPETTPPPAREYHIRRVWKGKAQIMGPVSEATIEKSIENGKIVRSDEIRLGDEGDWQRAGKIPGFAKLFNK